MPTHHYDIIICGAGAAGLSLAYRAIKEKVWDNKSILIIDSEIEKPEKTWCFWQNSNAPFENLVFKKWSQFSFFTNAGEAVFFDNGHYDYKMIRSSDFFTHTLSYLQAQKNVTFLYAKIDAIVSGKNKSEVHVKNNSYISPFVFNSVFTKPILKNDTIYLLQHFKGYFIKTKKPLFDEQRIHFMDFRVPQTNGSAFVYVLPFNAHEALIEYTVFSNQLLEPEAYDKNLKSYLSNILKVDHYEILKEEFGIIPMTDFPFERKNGSIINIGTQGGDTRGSTGYTFNNIQKTVSYIIEAFQNNDFSFSNISTIPKVHQWFDSTILQVLHKNKYQGHAIFTDIFKNVKAETVLKFLDGDTGMIENLKVMRSVKSYHFILPFIKAILK